VRSERTAARISALLRVRRLLALPSTTPVDTSTPIASLASWVARGGGGVRLCAPRRILLGALRGYNGLDRGDRDESADSDAVDDNDDGDDGDDENAHGDHASERALVSGLQRDCARVLASTSTPVDTVAQLVALRFIAQRFVCVCLCVCTRGVG
jgi:hypothetical protein